MIDISVILFIIGVVLFAIGILCYKHPRLNETMVSISLTIGVFLIIIGWIMISIYVTRTMGWYII